MPVPRAARLAARKSVIPDPSLYGDPSDDSDDDHATAPPARSTTIKTTTASSSKGKARASTAPRTSSVVVNGTRKQPRSSTESFDEPQEASKPPKQGSRPLDDPRRLDARDDRSTVNEPATKRKRIDKRGEDEPSGHRDDHIQTNRPTASATSAEAKNTTKRTKASQRPAEDEDPEDTARHSQSSSQRKGHFVVSLACPFSPRNASHVTLRFVSVTAPSCNEPVFPSKQTPSRVFCSSRRFRRRLGTVPLHDQPTDTSRAWFSEKTRFKTKTEPKRQSEFNGEKPVAAAL